MTLKISAAVTAAAVVMTMLLAPQVYAGGPRLDWPEDSTSEGKDCWIDGWDA